MDAPIKQMCSYYVSFQLTMIFTIAINEHIRTSTQSVQNEDEVYLRSTKRNKKDNSIDSLNQRNWLHWKWFDSWFAAVRVFCFCNVWKTEYSQRIVFPTDNNTSALAFLDY